jgi:hypothetical protein
MPPLRSPRRQPQAGAARGAAPPAWRPSDGLVGDDRAGAECRHLPEPRATWAVGMTAAALYGGLSTEPPYVGCVVRPDRGVKPPGWALALAAKICTAEHGPTRSSTIPGWMN